MDSLVCCQSWRWRRRRKASLRCLPLSCQTWNIFVLKTEIFSVLTVVIVTSLCRGGSRGGGGQRCGSWWWTSCSVFTTESRKPEFPLSLRRERIRGNWAGPHTTQLEQAGACRLWVIWAQFIDHRFIDIRIEWLGISSQAGGGVILACSLEPINKRKY